MLAYTYLEDKFMRPATVLSLCLAVVLTLPACKAKKMLDEASISAGLSMLQ